MIAIICFFLLSRRSKRPKERQYFFGGDHSLVVSRDQLTNERSLVDRMTYKNADLNNKRDKSMGGCKRIP